MHGGKLRFRTCLDFEPASRPRRGRSAAAARRAADVGAIGWAPRALELEIIGHGSKRAVGRAAQGISRSIRARRHQPYEPEELVLAALAGTPLEAIETELAAARSASRSSRRTSAAARRPRGRARSAGCSPRTSPDRGGSRPERRAIISSVRGRHGSRRAVQGRGRVVKNVTGYDVPKLLAGSWGTLAVFTEVTLRWRRCRDRAHARRAGLATADGAQGGEEAGRASGRRTTSRPGVAQLPERGTAAACVAARRASRRPSTRAARRSRGCCATRPAHGAARPDRAGTRVVGAARSRRSARRNRARYGRRSCGCGGLARTGQSVWRIPCRRRTRRGVLAALAPERSGSTGAGLIGGVRGRCGPRPRRAARGSRYGCSRRRAGRARERSVPAAARRARGGVRGV